MDMLNIFIGLVSVYLTLSLIVTALGEGISTLFNFKGATAEKIVASLVGQSWQEEFYRRPEIKCLSQPSRSGIDGAETKTRKPSYIEPALFADTLIAMVIARYAYPKQAPPPTAMPAVIDRALTGLANRLEPSDMNEKTRWQADTAVSQTLLRMWSTAGGDVAAFKLELIDWFDITADRSYGWYRRLLACWIFGAACVVVLAMNADTIQMYERISSDDDLRSSLVEKAVKVVKSGDMETPGAACAIVGLPEDCSGQDIIREAAAESLPVVGGQTVYAEGKQHAGEYLYWFVLKLFGLFLTAAAISLGAPFWFDLLKKVVEIRGVIGTGTAAGPVTAAAKKAPTGDQPIPAALSTINTDKAGVADLETLDGFEYELFGYSRLNLYWNARLSALSYASKEEAESTCSEEFGAQGVLLEDKASDAQCLVVTTEKCAIIAFRGTEGKLMDWTTDLDIELRKPSGYAAAAYEVHTGFNNALDAIWEKLVKELQDRGVIRRNLPIWLTGHSLGGAMAALAALRLNRELPRYSTGSTIAGIHTFGQPRVGNTDCANTLDALFAQRYFRSINHRDIVTRIPLPDTPDVRKKVTEGGSLKVHNYSHAGRVIYFNDLGRALMDPPIWYRRWDVVAVAADKDAMLGALRQSAADHSIDAYMSLHRQLLKT